MLVSLNVNGSTAPAYTLLTGRDDNGDGVFNDRPAGVGRNTLRASGQTTVNLQVAYQFAFGRTRTALPPGIGVFGGGGAAEVRTFDQGNARYRLQLFVQASESDEPGQLSRLQRHPDLAVLRTADDGQRDAED